MGRLALTVLYVVTTLLGPGLCCCSLASSTSSTGPASNAGASAVTATAVRSCCQPPAAPNGKHEHGPAKPSKCPCEHGQQVKSLPPGGTAHADLAAQLKLIDSLSLALFPATAFGPAADVPSPVAVTSPFVRPAGRDLLAVYSRLRC